MIILVKQTQTVIFHVVVVGGKMRGREVMRTASADWLS